MNDAEMWKDAGWDGKERVWDVNEIRKALHGTIEFGPTDDGKGIKMVKGDRIALCLAAVIGKAARISGRHPEEVVRVRLRENGKVDVEFDSPWRN